MRSFASEEASATADAVHRFCARAIGEALHEAALVPLDRTLWASLGEMGVLALSPGVGSGETLLAASACYALGYGAFPGPVPATFLATAILDADAVAGIADGTKPVALGTRGRMPWAHLATIFLALDGNEASLVEGRVGAPIHTLGDEGWAAFEVSASRSLGDWSEKRLGYDLTLAAYLVGGAERLLDAAAAYAAERRQFGKAIGDFQGVSLPLAAAATRIEAARGLLEAVAGRIDGGDAAGPVLAAAARRSASVAAGELIHVAHQTFGAFGTVKDGPVFAMSRRLRQWSQQAPAPDLPDAVVALASQASLLLLSPVASGNS